MGEPESVMWHVAPAAARESILSRGLDPTLSANGPDCCAIYLWDNLANAELYALDFMRYEDADIWVVEIDETLRGDLQEDEFFAGGYMAETFGEDPGAWFTLMPLIAPTQLRPHAQIREGCLLAA